MILSFMPNLPGGGPSEFAEKIQDGRKQHTFRTGKRWKPGATIHLWLGSPRQRRQIGSFEFFCFDSATTEDGKPIPYLKNYFDEWNGAFRPVCRAVERWKMRAELTRPTGDPDEFPSLKFGLWIGGRQIKGDELSQVAERDGLSLGQFLEYFGPRVLNAGGLLEGQVIHWGKHVYTPETASILKG